MAYGYNPVDFWRTHPTEFWWVVSVKTEKARLDARPKYAGGMSEKEAKSLYEWCMGDD